MDNIAAHGARDQHDTLDSDVEHETNDRLRTAPLDPDPLMRAAAELLAENALLLAQRNGSVAEVTRL